MQRNCILDVHFSTRRCSLTRYSFCPWRNILGNLRPDCDCNVWRLASLPKLQTLLITKTDPQNLFAFGTGGIWLGKKQTHQQKNENELRTVSFWKGVLDFCCSSTFVKPLILPASWRLPAKGWRAGQFPEDSRGRKFQLPGDSKSICYISVYQGMYLYNKRHILQVHFRIRWVLLTVYSKFPNDIDQHQETNLEYLWVCASILQGELPKKHWKKMSKDPIAHKQMWFLNRPHVPGYGILRSETGL